MKRFVLFLAGGKWQEPWIRFLKQKGHSILLVDPNEEPPCKKYCDVYFRCDVKETGRIRSFIESEGYKIEFVTSEQTDVTTIPVAVLSAAFGIRHNPLKTVERFSNKYICREFISEKFGTDHIPQFRKIHDAEELALFQQETGKDLIVKPADAQSSRGIFTVPAKSGAVEYTSEIKESLAGSRCDYLIAEEFIHGREITVEGIVTEYQHEVLAMSSKKHFRTGIASDLEYPLLIDEDFKGEIVDFHNKLVEAAGLGFGITHSEYLIDTENKDFYLVEMACRGGGSLIPSDIVPWVSGVNVYELLYKQLTGKPAELPEEKQHTSSKAATLHFFEFDSGKVKSISGVEEANRIPGVHRLELEFKTGDMIYPASDDRGRQGFAILMGGSPDDIQAIRQQVYKILTIEYQEESAPLMVPGTTEGAAA